MAKPQQSLEQVQEQRLQQRLNPQSVALGRMLEMSTPEFEDDVRRELDENPALEATDVPDESPAENDFSETAEELQRADFSDDEAPDYPASGRYSADNQSFDPVSIAVADGPTLMENLLTQLRDEFELTPDQRRIALHILGNLDSNGYMHRSLSSIADEVAIAEGIDVSDAEVKDVFRMVRQLDPPGIGAVDLRDCLLLQLDRKPKDVTVLTAREIIDRYFDLFSKKHFEKLQSHLGISRNQLAQALEYIHTLNPKPAAGLESVSTSDRTGHIVPDFVLSYDDATDSFTLSLTSRIPDLGLEATFNVEPENSESPAVRKADREADAFIRRKRESALDFIKLVKMRNNTLMTIGRAIVEWQHDFFTTGDRSDIKPMILKDISARTGLDLSVISRATAGKYILTTFGTYPLKLFFNERPDADTDVSAHKIMTVIKELVDAEDKSNPLSDRAINEALTNQGYELARRTVAKYRERLNIPVARLRKKI